MGILKAFRGINYRMVSDYKQTTVHWKQPVRINKMKADTSGDGLESFPLEKPGRQSRNSLCLSVWESEQSPPPWTAQVSRNLAHFPWGNSIPTPSTGTRPSGFVLDAFPLAASFVRDLLLDLSPALARSYSALQTRIEWQWSNPRKPKAKEQHRSGGRRMMSPGLSKTLSTVSMRKMTVSLCSEWDGSRRKERKCRELCARRCTLMQTVS